MDDRPGVAVQPDRELATPKDKLMSNGGVNEPHWERVKELFAHAVSLPPHARAEWIVQACGDDAELLAELNALLGAHDGAGDFLNTPVLADPAAAQAVADATQSADTPQPVPARCGPYRIVREARLKASRSEHPSHSSRSHSQPARRTLPLPMVIAFS